MNDLLRAQKMAATQRKFIREAESKQRHIEITISNTVHSAMLLNEYFVMSAVYAALAEPRSKP